MALKQDHSNRNRPGEAKAPDKSKAAPATAEQASEGNHNKPDQPSTEHETGQTPIEGAVGESRLDPAPAPFNPGPEQASEGPSAEKFTDQGDVAAGYQEIITAKTTQATGSTPPSLPTDRENMVEAVDHGNSNQSHAATTESYTTGKVARADITDPTIDPMTGQVVSRAEFNSREENQ